MLKVARQGTVKKKRFPWEGLKKKLAWSACCVSFVFTGVFEHLGPKAIMSI